VKLVVSVSFQGVAMKLRLGMPNDLKRLFGNQLAFVRRRRQMTQSQLAGLVGISVGALYKIEKGKAAPEFATIEKLTSVLKIDVAAFFAPAEAVPSSNPRVLETVQKLEKLPAKDLELILKIIDRFGAKNGAQHSQDRTE
jgi:transcriptional regulator with XRE-family HTH domain